MSIRHFLFFNPTSPQDPEVFLICFLLNNSYWSIFKTSDFFSLLPPLYQYWLYPMRFFFFLLYFFFYNFHLVFLSFCLVVVDAFYVVLSVHSFLFQHFFLIISWIKDCPIIPTSVASYHWCLFPCMLKLSRFFVC